MKLAEALILRADLKKALASLRYRIGKIAIVQEGDVPHEDPAELLQEAFGVMQQLESLVSRINESNVKITLENGKTLAQMITYRESLTTQHSLLQHAITSSHRDPDRYRSTEIKWVATMKVAQLQKQSDDLSKRIRETNMAIQEKNWTADLVD